MPVGIFHDVSRTQVFEIPKLHLVLAITREKKNLNREKRKGGKMGKKKIDRGKITGKLSKKANQCKWQNLSKKGARGVKLTYRKEGGKKITAVWGKYGLGNDIL
jgi:cobyrinic acid a,c-diamide synthase